MNIAQLEIDEFLERYPRIRARPTRGVGLVFEGTHELNAIYPDAHPIIETIELRIVVERPQADHIHVWETGGVIPKSSDYHVNDTGTLCLGSPLKLLSLCEANHSLTYFFEICVEPFLYRILHKLRFEYCPGGELAHGSEGVAADYCELLDLQTPQEVVQALNLLSLKKRLANKKPCPCGCKLRLGKCSYNDRLKQLRKLASRGWFHGQLSLHFDAIQREMETERRRCRERHRSRLKKLAM